MLRPHDIITLLLQHANRVCERSMIALSIQV